MNAAAGETVGRIELRLRRLDQLFDSYDPAPFHEKDLDPDAEEFIVSWAREHGPSKPLQFVLHLPEDQRPLEPERVVREAIANYFTYRVELAGHELRRMLQLGRKSLLVGLGFLVVCVTLRELASGLGTADWVRVLQEGLLIIGWVAMWRPIEILLYDWWPIRARRATFSRLAAMGVEVCWS
ncbi:MAG: hypothetical protein RL398_3678 [Planctomycetota bacterium]|jgi:hypothetical protein